MMPSTELRFAYLLRSMWTASSSVTTTFVFHSHSQRDWFVSASVLALLVLLFAGLVSATIAIVVRIRNEKQ